MVIKKFRLPLIILAVLLVLTVLLACLEGIVMRPVIKEHTFEFSITYELNGEQTQLSHHLYCTLEEVENTMTPQERFWHARIVENVGMESDQSYSIYKDGSGELILMTDICPACLMGDGESCGCAEEGDKAEPYFAFYDLEGVEYTGEELPAHFEARVVSWEYPEPIENELEFSHIARLDGDTSFDMTFMALAALIACLVFVKKDGDVVYTQNDKLGTILNFLVGFAAVPFISIACALVGINGGGDDILSQIMYCIPSVSVIALGASICLRRKGYSRSSIVVQFAGPALFALAFIAGIIEMFAMSI